MIETWLALLITVQVPYATTVKGAKAQIEVLETFNGPAPSLLCNDFIIAARKSRPRGRWAMQCMSMPQLDKVLRETFGSAELLR